MKKMYKTPEIDVLAIIGAQGICNVSGLVRTGSEGSEIQSDAR